MPDLDEGNQEMQEQRVYAAFFWSLVAGFVEPTESHTERKVYRLKIEKLNLRDKSDVMVVSNGSSCDQLYEVLDALFIYPELVDNILERVDYMTSQDVNNSSEAKSIDSGRLFKALRTFRIKEFPLGEKDAVRSTLEIPVLMKKSIKPDMYREDDVLNILRALILEIKKYIDRFCSEKDYPKVLGDFLRDELDIYAANLAIESKESSFDYYDHLFKRTCEIVEEEFEALDLQKHIDAVSELVKSKGTRTESKK